MGKHLFLIITAFLVSSISADLFTCPPKTITLGDGATGYLPIGGSGITQVSKGTNCTIFFDIEVGYAVKLEISTNHDPSLGDEVIFDGDVHVLPSFDAATTEFGVRTSVPLQIYANSDDFTFFATYTYFDLKAYTQQVKLTGEYFSATIAPMQYFTIKSGAGDSVVATISREDFAQQQTQDIFVYDGSDIINSNFLGRLNSVYGKLENSHTESLSFVNFKASDSKTFIIGNDHSKVNSFDANYLVVVDKVEGLNQSVTNDNDGGKVLYTFICDGCDQFYINSLSFKHSTSGSAQFQGMSPTDAMPVLLNYPLTGFTQSQLPQLIPSPIVTAIFYDASVDIDLQTTQQGIAKNAQDQKVGSIISPTLWNPNNDGSFKYFIESQNVYDFVVSFVELQFSEAADKLEIKFLNDDGSPTFEKLYNKANAAFDDVQSSGSSISFEYTGSKDSKIILVYSRTQKVVPPATGATGATGLSTEPIPITSSTKLSSASVTSTVAPTKAPASSPATSTRLTAPTTSLTTPKTKPTDPITVKTAPTTQPTTRLFTTTTMTVETTTAGASPSTFLACFIAILLLNLVINS